MEVYLDVLLVRCDRHCDLGEVLEWLIGPDTLFNVFLGAVNTPVTPAMAHAALVVLTVVNTEGCLIIDEFTPVCN